MNNKLLPAAGKECLTEKGMHKLKETDCIYWADWNISKLQGKSTLREEWNIQRRLFYF